MFEVGESQRVSTLRPEVYRPTRNTPGTDNQDTSIHRANRLRTQGLIKGPGIRSGSPTQERETLNSQTSSSPVNGRNQMYGGTLEKSPEACGGAET